MTSSVWREGQTTRRCAWRPGRWSGKGNSNAGTSAVLRHAERHAGQLNGSTTRRRTVGGLRTPGLGLRLVNLPATAHGWAREEATGTCASVPRFRRGSAASSPGWPAMKCGAAGSNQGRDPLARHPTPSQPTAGSHLGFGLGGTAGTS